MARNSRQKRSQKRKLAIALLAKVRNPPMVASEGRVRSVWGKTMPPARVGPGKASDVLDTAYRRSNWEARGTVGKVVKGHVVKPPKPLYRADGSPVRLIEHDKLAMQRAPITSPDTLRVAAAKSRLRRKEKDADDLEAIAERLAKPFTGKE